MGGGSKLKTPKGRKLNMARSITNRRRNYQRRYAKKVRKSARGVYRDEDYKTSRYGRGRHY